jgi:hypothetical protein
VAPDRTALASGLTGLALVVTASVPWAWVANHLAGHPAGPAHPAWAEVAFRLASVTALCLGALAIWSAIKAWLRDDALSPRGRWGMALGLAVLVLVVALGPCGTGGCKD